MTDRIEQLEAENALLREALFGKHGVTTGLQIIEKALVDAKDPANAPFPLHGESASLWRDALTAAYQHALEMICVSDEVKKLAPAESDVKSVEYAALLTFQSRDIAPVIADIRDAVAYIPSYWQVSDADRAFLKTLADSAEVNGGSVRFMATMTGTAEQLASMDVLMAEKVESIAGKRVLTNPGFELCKVAIAGRKDDVKTRAEELLERSRSASHEEPSAPAP